MGVRKNPFTGDIVEEDTTRHREPGAAAPDIETPTVQVPGGAAFAPSPGGAGTGSDWSDLQAPTARVGQAPPPGPAQRSGTEDDLPTGLYRPRPPGTGPARDTEADREAPQPAGRAGHSEHDPVVGIVVVLTGPGKGQLRTLGYGSNSIGRSENSRIRLDFGDSNISRDAHATLTYDARGRKFYIQHNGGRNLTYLADQPVLVPTVLEHGQDITLGATTLRFVPFCGPDFDWQDTE